MLIKRVKSARDQLPWGPLGPPPLLVKIAPDLPASERKDVAAVALRHGLQVCSGAERVSSCSGCAADGCCLSTAAVPADLPACQHLLMGW